VRFTNRPENKMRMAQAAAEIIQAYHQNMHGDKLGDLLNGPESAALQLPEGVVLRDVDTRHLTLPFPPSAILPTMRMIFSEMGDRVRFALSDQQVNSISTGTYLFPDPPLTFRHRFYQAPYQPTKKSHQSSQDTSTLHRTRQDSIPC